MRLDAVPANIATLLLLLSVPFSLRANETLEWHHDIAPILNRYCAGCHNDDASEGDLSLESYPVLFQDRENGRLVQPGNAEGSRLIEVIAGTAEPKMPPDDEAQLTQQEIDVLKRWVQGGAKVSVADVQADKEEVPRLATPELDPSRTPKPITAVAYSPDGRTLAVARFRSVDLVTADDQRFIQHLSDHPGKVNDVRFTRDGRYLIAATGIAGLFGEARIWDIRSGRLVRRVGGHRDVLYAAVPSHDGRLLATAGYDRTVVIWDLETGEKRLELEGHNGPIYDLAFSPDGSILASASADATVKIWNVASGQRLDTLSQPLQQQNSVDISPDGKFLIAAGEDNRIRLWRLISIDKPRINPILIARFAHEKPIASVRFTTDGNQVLSLAGDRKIKVWDAKELMQQLTLDVGTELAQALAIRDGTNEVAVGRMDGGLIVKQFAIADSITSGPVTQADAAADLVIDGPSESPDAIAEREPNDLLEAAQSLEIPARVAGTIWAAGSSTDVDLFRFTAKRGETLVLETRAARDKSPLDSRIAVFDHSGKPVARVQLRAVRDSYFKFRGKDSNQTGDFRLHNWREMELNQYLYASGEVVKLYHYPRGPDSGFNVYPNFGRRHAFFDTTCVTHALHEPCYIVEPLAPDVKRPPNGLPTFMINYENDDESRARYGKDSYLIFVAPQDGEYVVRVEDVRGLQGESYKYELVVRRPQPDFSVSITNANPSVPKGAGRKFGVQVQRVDGFEGEIRVEIDQLPAGFSASQPIVIQSGQLRGWGTIMAAADAELADPEASKQSRVTASAVINGATVTKEVGSLGEIKLEDAPKLFVHFSADGEDAEFPVIEIEAGTTATAHIRIDRQGHDGRVGFGSEEAVFNSPHGVYVDNIGLNGVLITETQSERTIYITAEPWVEDSERLVFIEAGEGGRPTSRPVLMRVKGRRDTLSPQPANLGVAQ